MVSFTNSHKGKGFREANDKNIYLEHNGCLQEVIPGLREANCLPLALPDIGHIRGTMALSCWGKLFDW